MAYSSLSSSVSSLRNSIGLLDSSISILDAGVNDFPRLAKVLTMTRHFELTDEHTLLTAQREVMSEITPEVTRLLARAEAHVSKLERREQSLIAKAELQAGRLSQSGRRRSSVKMPAYGAGSHGGGKSKGANGNEERLRVLRQKKERLGYAVERLSLQAQQKERQLRMSMAAQ
ncbi:MAG: hypothetical protein M1817_003827 [Caeruleum heppii]|nr:MAG: hypothetical protein M1817_003827 [Caeruleum heppii]